MCKYIVHLGLDCFILVNFVCKRNAQFHITFFSSEHPPSPPPPLTSTNLCINLHQFYTGTQGNKLQRERTTFKVNHLKILESCFNDSKHPDASRRAKIASQLGLPVKTIQIWFQNRRARERKYGKEKKASDDNSNADCNAGKILIFKKWWILGTTFPENSLVSRKHFARKSQNQCKIYFLCYYIYYININRDVLKFKTGTYIDQAKSLNTVKYFTSVIN